MPAGRGHRSRDPDRQDPGSEGLVMKRRVLRKSSVLLTISLASAAGLAVASAGWAAAAPTTAAPTTAAPTTAPSWHVLETVTGISQDFGAVVATGPVSGW